MSVFARAWKSIIRQPMKSLILLVTVAVLGTLIAGAVSMKQGLVSTQKQLESKMKIKGSIQLKREIGQNIKSEEEFLALARVDEAMMVKIAALPQVQGYERTSSVNLYSSTLISKRLGTGTSRDVSLSVLGPKNGALLDYSMGNVTLTSGRWLTAEDETSNIKPIVISEDFARDNNLTLGSSLTMNLKIYDQAKANKDVMNNDIYIKVGEATFSVVGTFRVTDSHIVMEGTLYTASQSNALRAYAPYSVVHELEKLITEKTVELNHMNKQLASFSYPNLMVWLKDRQSADAFTAEVAKVGLPQQYEVALSTEVYDNTMSPVQNLGWIVNLVIVAAVVSTIAILGLVISLILKSRQLEIGILLSLGERKKRIIQQIAAEILIVTVLGLTISAFAGYRLSQGVSDQMVKNQVQSLVASAVGREGYNKYDGEAFYTLSRGTPPPLGADTFIWIYLAGLLTAGAASVLPVMLTLRQNPKDILMKGE